jgi:hypothetical protein
VIKLQCPACAHEWTDKSHAHVAGGVARQSKITPLERAEMIKKSVEVRKLNKEKRHAQEKDQGQA